MTALNSAGNRDSKIKVAKDGPYLVFGNIPLFNMVIKCDEKGIPIEWGIGQKLKTSQNYALCRCGQTKTKPFCDGSHIKVNFDGTETSTQTHSNQAKEIDGPTLKLSDIEILCASARFCHRGMDIWLAVPKSDDPATKKIAVEDSCDCPSGRLVVFEKADGKVVEPSLERAIGLIIDPAIGGDGPLWIRGGIPVYSADGVLYEVRNRMTLCRCGKSQNKPFCDSSHYPEEDREVK